VLLLLLLLLALLCCTGCDIDRWPSDLLRRIGLALLRCVCCQRGAPAPAADVTLQFTAVGNLFT
jgi:hypothetical protein